MFFFQFETICQNHLDYDYGLKAIAEDDLYDEKWKHWIMSVRHRIGMVGLADLVYVSSQHYLNRQSGRVEFEGQDVEMPEVVLFGAKEGRIALANRCIFSPRFNDNLVIPLFLSRRKKIPSMTFCQSL
jgi:hypothetical protein